MKTLILLSLVLAIGMAISLALAIADANAQNQWLRNTPTCEHGTIVHPETP